jgi:hypothetical protein
MLDFLGSLVQPAVKLIDRVTARPRIGAHFDWIQHAGSPVLRFFFINNGRRREAIVDIRFQTDATPLGQGWTRQHAIMDRLPVTLEPHTASTPFELTTDSPSEEFDRLLRDGEITMCEIETTARRNRRKTFHVPLPPSRALEDSGG